MISLKSLILEGRYGIPEWTPEFYQFLLKHSNDPRNNDATFCKENVNKVIQHIKSLDEKPCFRVMYLPPEQFYSRLTHIGENWAETFEACETFLWDECEDKIEKNDKIIMFQGRINIDNINWPLTIAHRLFYNNPITEGEVEIIFIPNTTIYVERVFKYKLDFHKWFSHPFEKALRI